jgi:membrane protein implicated in regulation of membrane protease activity
VKELSSWSPRRVIVACMLWLLGAPVLAAIGLLLGGLVLAAFSGRQPIGFTVSLSNWSWAWLFLPPIGLIGAWIWSRRRAD